MTAPGRTRDFPALPSPWERLDMLAELETRDIGPLKFGRAAQVVRCPLPDHDDRTPSCSLSLRDGGVWLVNCHGCGFAGDGIDLLAAVDGQRVEDWLSARHRRDEPLVVRPVAQPAPRPAPPAVDPDVLDPYLTRCHTALLEAPEAGAVRRYARERGLSGDMVRAHRLGFGLPAPGGIDRRIAGRLIFPTPGGLEARTIDDDGPKYLTVGPKRAWGLDPYRYDVRPDWGPLLIVEGILDAIACRRPMPDDRLSLNYNTVALRGKTLQPEDAAELAERGFRTAYVGLDADAPEERIDQVAYRLLTAGVQPYIVRGPSAGDWGDLLTMTNLDDLVVRFSEAVKLA